MERPFILVDFRSMQKKEFLVTVGHQDFNSIFIVLEGSYRIVMNGKEEVVKKGDAMIFDDYTEFNRNVIEPIEFIYIRFKTNPKCPFTVKVPMGKIVFKDSGRIESNIRNYLALENSSDKNVMFYKEHILNDILYQAHIENCLTPDSDVVVIEDTTVNAAIAYIKSHINSQIKTEDICKAISSNQSTINYKFRKHTGMSVIQFVTHKKIEMAKWLLSNSNYSITEISQKCGFSDIYYFSSTFKKNSGLTPTNYRNQFI